MESSLICGVRSGAVSASACGPLRALGHPLALLGVLGQRGGRPRRAACSLAQMPLRHAMGLARPPRLARVTLQHARILPAARRSHPPRLRSGLARLRGSPGSGSPNTRSPVAKACGGRVWRAFWGAEEHRACGQRAARSSSFSSPLSERRERSERSEFGDAAARPSTAGQSARSAPDRPSEAPHPTPTRLCRPPPDTAPADAPMTATGRKQAPKLAQQRCWPTETDTCQAAGSWLIRSTMSRRVL